MQYKCQFQGKQATLRSRDFKSSTVGRERERERERERDRETEREREREREKKRERERERLAVIDRQL
jgi:hypothetical protein